jgi:xanthine dehydrogenase iron-sulfur cluster and FAD-binding subunit A
VKRTCLEPGELVESVRVPIPQPAPSRALFRKVGTRAAQAISKTVAAGLLWRSRDGSVAELRFALGSMAPTVRRLRHAEEVVKGKRLTPDVVREACALVAKDVAPIDDVRSTAEYRLAVSRNLLFRFLSEGR